MKYSFIVPTYNSQGTIVRALDSIIEANLNDYEIILIDDESKDNTVEIVNEYFSDKNVNHKVIQSQGGVSNSRNIGISESTGDRILFIDSDDYYLSNTLNKIQDISNDADLIIFNFEHGDKLVNLYTEENVRTIMIENPTKYMTVWGKMFKAETLKNNDIFFNENLKLSEDSDFMIRYTKFCQKIKCESELLYHYSIDNPSTVRSVDVKKIDGYLEALEATFEFIKKYDQEMLTSFYIYTLMQVNIMMVRIVFVMNSGFFRKQKQKLINNILTNNIINESLTNLKIYRMLSLRMLPILFIKLKLNVGAEIIYRLRSFINYRKENN